MTSSPNGQAPAETGPDQAHMPVVKQAVQALEQSLEDLDYATQIHLQKARAAALSELDRPAKPAKSKWLWLTAVPAALAIVLLLPQQTPSPTSYPEALAMVQDFDILVAGEDVDMIRDMELLEWIDEQEFKRAAEST